MCQSQEPFNGYHSVYLFEYKYTILYEKKYQRFEKLFNFIKFYSH